VWQADRELSGIAAVGGVERRSRRLGHISTQGNALLRFLPVEAAHVTVRSLPEWRSKYFHLETRAEDCEGRDGSQASHSAVLDDAQGMGLRAGKQIWSARGTAENRCGVQ